LFRERVVERSERGRELLVGERPAISALPDACRPTWASVTAARRCDVSTMTHGPPDVVREKRDWSLPFVPEAWASLAIAVMWLAVLFTALWGPDIVNRGAGGDSSTVPSVVPVAIFAFFATWVVAKYGFRRRRED
jgi:hypothetical protein